MPIGLADPPSCVRDRQGAGGGQWGAGKTFGVLDMSGSVMTGEPFAGRR